MTWCANTRKLDGMSGVRSNGRFGWSGTRGPSVLGLGVGPFGFALSVARSLSLFSAGPGSPSSPSSSWSSSPLCIQSP